MILTFTDATLETGGWKGRQPRRAAARGPSRARRLRHNGTDLPPDGRGAAHRVHPDRRGRASTRGRRVADHAPLI